MSRSPTPQVLVQRPSKSQSTPGSRNLYHGHIGVNHLPFLNYSREFGEGISVIRKIRKYRISGGFPGLKIGVVEPLI